MNRQKQVYRKWFTLGRTNSGDNYSSDFMNHSIYIDAMIFSYI